MKTNIFQRSLLFFFFVLLSSRGIAQYHTSDETTVGILVEPTFSGFGYNGLTPSVTIGCSTYQIQVGPRFSFAKMTGNAPEKQQDIVWDIGYRYSFIQRYGFSAFAAARCEYGIYRFSNDWQYSYPAPNPAPFDITETYSFNARTVGKHYNANFYLGAGVEFIVVNKLYLTAFGAAGIKTLTGYSQTFDRDSNTLVSTSDWLFEKQGTSWIASFGVGYRL